MLDFDLVYFNTCLNIHEQKRDEMPIQFEFDPLFQNLTLIGPYWPEREMDEIKKNHPGKDSNGGLHYYLVRDILPWSGIIYLNNNTHHYMEVKEESQNLDHGQGFCKSLSLRNPPYINKLMK